MDRSRLKELFGACSLEPISPSDRRWVDLDAARGVAIAADLVDEITYATQPIVRVVRRGGP